jgi:type I restriction enzyme S subunit
MAFPLRTLEEVLDIQSGKRLPAGHDFADVPTLHPYIRARDIRDGKITFNDPVYISEETHQAIRKYTVSTGDVCITIVGANVGDIGSVPEYLDGSNLTENAVKLVNLRQLDSRYLKYVLLSDELQRTMKLVAAGAAQPKLGIYKIKALQIPYPQFPIQERIAEILSAYDDLIDNNNRRISLLEEATHRLYREWFVHLCFPGYEHTPLVAGVPEGWEKRPIGEVLLTLPRKQCIKKGDYLSEGRIPTIDQGSTFIGGYTNDDEALHDSPLPVVIFGDHTRILKFVDFPFASGADGTQILYPKPDYLDVWYLYCGLTSVDLSNYAYARHFKFLKQQTILIPSSKIQESFRENAEPTMKQISTLRSMNRKLAEARDALLPRLMKGSLAI